MTTKKPARPSVKLVHGKATTTSLKLAEYFGKAHYRVLRAIEKLECSPEFRAANFGASQYVVKTPSGGMKSQPMYIITKDGFMFLAMGFTGKEAAQWKERYIAAFNELERRALEKAAAKRLPKPAAPLLSKPAALPVPEQSLEALALSRLRAVKFVMYFDELGDMCLFSRSRSCVVAEPQEIAALIADPKSKIGRECLPGIISAAVGRLS